MNVALANGMPKKKANDREALALIKQEWAAMSEEEQNLATDEHLKKMTEDRATRLTGENNSGIAAFHDAVSTFRSMEDQV